MSKASLSAPFFNSEGELFVEVHDIDLLFDRGHDTLDNVAVLCQNQHCEVYLGANKERLAEQLAATREAGVGRER